MITRKAVSATVGPASAFVEYYGTGDAITVTVNGVMAQFPTYIGDGMSTDAESTLQALKEAIGEI